MPEQSHAVRFEEIALPHLPAAYNLARWLVRNDHDAEDVVQEAYLRAFKFFGGYRGGESRTWLLTIVRNTCYTWLQQNRARELTDSIDETKDEVMLDFANPEVRLVQDVDAQMVRAASPEPQRWVTKPNPISESPWNGRLKYQPSAPHRLTLADSDCRGIADLIVSFYLDRANPGRETIRQARRDLR